MQPTAPPTGPPPANRPTRHPPTATTVAATAAAASPPPPPLPPPPPSSAARRHDFFSSSKLGSPFFEDLHAWRLAQRAADASRNLLNDWFQSRGRTLVAPTRQRRRQNYFDPRPASLLVALTWVPRLRAINAADAQSESRPRCRAACLYYKQRSVALGSVGSLPPRCCPASASARRPRCCRRRHRSSRRSIREPPTLPRCHSSLRSALHHPMRRRRGEI